MALRLNYDWDNTGSIKSVGGLGPTPTLTRATEISTYDEKGWRINVASGRDAYRGATWSRNYIPDHGIDWVALRATSSETTEVAPPAGFGPIPVNKLADDATASNTHICYDSIVGAAAGVYTYSDCFHAGTLPRVAIRMVVDTSTTQFAYFDLVNGVILDDDTAGNNAQMVDLGGGWYRVSISATHTSGSVGYGFGGGPDTVDVVAGNFPAYNGTNGTLYLYEAGGMLERFEEHQATQQNLINAGSRAEDFTEIGVVCANNAATAPDGTLTADSITDTATGPASHAAYTTATVEQGDIYYWDFHVKANGITKITTYTSGGGSFLASTRVNLTNGTVDSGDSTSTVITDVGNGWYRIRKWGLAPADGTPIIWIALYNGAGSYTGTGTDGVYVWRMNAGRVGADDVRGGKYLETTAASGARLLYGPGGYAPPGQTLNSSTTLGLEHWEATTNLCDYSSDFSNATWIVNGGTKTTGFKGIDGKNTMVKLEGSGGGTGSLVIGNTLNLSTSTRYTISWDLKAGASTWVMLYWGNAVVDPRVYFDLENGVIGATIGAAAEDYGMDYLGAGIYRCWISFTTDAVDATGSADVYVADGDGDIAVLKDATSSVFAGNCQVEQKNRPTPYVDVPGAGTATRNLQTLNTTDLSWYSFNDTETWLVDFSPGGDVSGINNFGMELSDGSASDRLYFNVQNAVLGQVWRATTAGPGNYNFTANTGGAARVRIGLTFNPEVGYAYFNGTASGANPDTTGATGTNWTRLDLGSSFASNSCLNGLLHQIKYYDEQVAPSDADQLSEGAAFLGGQDTILKRKQSRDRFRRRYRRT